MPDNSENVLDVLVNVLTPYVGATMARASVRTYQAQLGIEGKHVTPKQLEGLFERLKGLAVFVGQIKAEAARRQMESELRRRKMIA